MKTTEIRTVDLTRRIRAAHAEQLRGASAEERIRFYRAKARQLHAELEPLLEEAEGVGSGAAHPALAGDETAAIL